MSSRQYLENRIREALKKAKGNKHQARQQIIAWTYEDSKLLHALARPHLEGIIAYNIDRMLSGKTADNRENEAVSKKPQAGAKAKKGEEFGMDLLRAVVATDAAIFGQESLAPSSKRPQTSKRHVDALMKMASGVETKKSKTDKT
ncbi:MAG: hypothetical protein KA099_02590 [Alphaproteobacteria bacterium]|nr:hypothetical protein [Alphaproteobacteria bacterium]MBP7758959.1 hypothetical protein [Alphaproteobacteria bacterium]MBP7762234.1 hypothetical protein [Alphaproteobacteria bacterium]MBP7904189.1 hypothetical protein [Alphaproteobacteria bacterium]